MNTLTRKRQNAHHQKGVALAAAMITLLLVTAITAGMIILANTETNISANFRDEQNAYFAAKAGMEEIRDRLQVTATNSLTNPNLLPTTLPGTANGVLYILNPANGETVAPWGANYPDDEICKEGMAGTSLSCGTNGLPSSGSGWYTQTTASPTYAQNPTLNWKWTRITLKTNNMLAPYYTNGGLLATQVCWNGSNEETTSCAKPNEPVYVLTTLAVTPSGSRRMIQTEVARDEIVFNAPAALTIGGTGDTFSGGSSNQWGVNGNDVAGCGSTTTGPSVHAIGTTDTPDVTTVVSGINRPNNITGVGASTPDVANISSSLPPDMQSPTALQALMSSIKADVTQPVINGPASGLSNPGTLANPQIIYVNGDLSMSGNTVGYGILVVTGTFTASGTVGWNGLVFVVGKGIFNANGTTSWTGDVTVANTVDTLGNTLPTWGPAQVNISGGGHGGFQYSSGCMNLMNTQTTYHVMAVRELMR